MVATASPRRVGRPRTRTTEGRGDYVGFRASRELKEKLEAAAAVSRRSLSTEAQFRLERSFEREGLLDEALELAFDRQLAGLLLMIGTAMRTAGTLAALEIGGTSQELNDWVYNPYAFNQAIEANKSILEGRRPTGSPKFPKNEAPNYLGSKIGTELLTVIQRKSRHTKQKTTTTDRLAERVRKLLGDDHQ